MLPAAHQPRFFGMRPSLGRFLRAHGVAFLLMLACTGLTSAMPALSVSERVEIQADLSYAENANPRQSLDLYLPKSRIAGARLPVIVYIHGGGWGAGSKAAGLAILLPWVAKGSYAGVSLNYRLADEAPWPAQIHDCKAAIRWIRAHAVRLGLDEGKIGVMGTSAGGTLATLLGTSGGVPDLEGAVGPHRTEDSHVTCVLNRFGRLNFVAEPESARSAPAQAKALSDRMTTLFGGTLAEKGALARRASPIVHLSSDDPPILTFHGTMDGIVPVVQAEEFDAAARRAGSSHLLVLMVGAGHGFDHPEEKRRSLQFLDRHLRGIADQISTEPILMPPKP